MAGQQSLRGRQDCHGGFAGVIEIIAFAGKAAFLAVRRRAAHRFGAQLRVSGAEKTQQLVHLDRRARHRIGQPLPEPLEEIRGVVVAFQPAQSPERPRGGDFPDLHRLD